MQNIVNYNKGIKSIQKVNQTYSEIYHENANNVTYYPDKYGTQWLECLGKPIKITQN